MGGCLGEKVNATGKEKVGDERRKKGRTKVKTGDEPRSAW